MAEGSISDDNTTIRIAIFRMSPEEGNFTANHATIEEAIHISAENGADWFLTPEMAESGYEFTDYMSIDQLPEFPSPWISRLENLSREENITLFIGFPERIGDNFYNSVAVINQEGNISGIFQKTDIIPGTHEGWATPGNASPLTVDNLKIGYYICADAVNLNITDLYIASDVDIMLSSAAWYPDPEMGPESYWENITLMSDVPLVIANTVGKKGRLDFTHANSGVFQNGRELYQIPGTEQVIAFVDWNYLTGEILPAGEEEPV
ncbi:MAG TPA: carbon-nitrogen hydrolase family protein [Methanospirillum sp.]|nr:carbon-nitrogen hydrolase family protein [Methanospirillum sp.]